MTQRGWIGVDLDGTVAQYAGWDGGKIGPPIPAMVNRIKTWLADGQQVKIVTARVAPTGQSGSDIAEQRQHISDWCLEHLGQRLEVTCQKDFAMIQLYDDRCVQVVANTGRLVIEYPYPNEQAAAIVMGLHPDEARPRAESWLHERLNWQTEVEQLRATVAAQAQVLQTPILDDWDKIAKMREIQGRIQIEREILAFSEEKREALDRFVAGAHLMTLEEIDAVTGAFGDAEGTYVRRFESGRKAMDRWIDHYEHKFQSPESSDQEVVEAARGAGLKVGWTEDGKPTS